MPAAVVWLKRQIVKSCSVHQASIHCVFVCTTVFMSTRLSGSERRFAWTSIQQQRHHSHLQHCHYLYYFRIYGFVCWYLLVTILCSVGELCVQCVMFFVAFFLFCCVTVDAINETVAAFYNDTDLLSGEFMAPPSVCNSSQFLAVAFNPLTTDHPTPCHLWFSPSHSGI